MNDSEFDNLLRTAKDDVPLPSSFRSDVWNRIASEEQGSSLGWFHSIAAAFVRPWTAAGGVLATVALGLFLGAVSAPEAKDAKVVYAESVSPFIQHSQK